jgi:uncharacterized protein YciI
VITFLVLTLISQFQAGPAAQEPQAPAVQLANYQMVLLRKGPNANAPQKDAQKMQAEHLARLDELSKKKTNLVYGPLLDDQDIRGFAIMDVPTPEAAKKLFDDDPYVKAGAMVVEARPIVAPKDFTHPPADPHQPDRFVIGFVFVGAATGEQDPATAQQLQLAHVAYQQKLHADGKVLIEISSVDSGEPRGLLIFSTQSVDEARVLLEADPVFKARWLKVDLHPWMTWKGILR